MFLRFLDVFLVADVVAMMATMSAFVMSSRWSCRSEDEAVEESHFVIGDDVIDGIPTTLPPSSYPPSMTTSSSSSPDACIDGGGMAME